MTEREIAELQRLEVNVHRMAQLIEQQAGLIASLRQDLSEREAEIVALQARVREAEQAYQMARLGAGVTQGDTEAQATAEYLATVISEIESCIAQLRQE